MRLIELRVANLRNIEELAFEPAAGFNVVTGPNGAGKTSILEAIYLLSHARSFRTRRAEYLARASSRALSVFGVVERAGASASRLGLSEQAGRWLAHLDGSRAGTLVELLERCAVVCFEPGSHELISGSSEGRRELLDWGVFHVEHDFAAAARRYRRALRQRNAALRANCSETELDSWDSELSCAAEPIDSARLRYFDRLAERLRSLLGVYLPELGESTLAISAGWRDRVERGLLAQLSESRATDRQRAHTTRGPHRSDWTLRFAAAPRREHLSRGQEKLCAIACMLAQAHLYRDDHAEWPIVLLDDLPSELDLAHQAQVVASLNAAAQVFMTGTEFPAVLGERAVPCRTFHVEQGRLRALL